MKTKGLTAILALGLFISVFGQKETFKLTFSSIDNTAYVRLDSIRVMNRTQGGDTVLYWPDTVFIVNSVKGSHQEGRDKESGNFIFTHDDELLYIGYTGALESGIMDKPEESDTMAFQFATNIPCPGIPTVTYGGQVYHTVQIFSQCWLKENLNVGTMVDGNQYQTDNGILEKYCYDNQPDSCTKYGGLYQWGEMMKYLPLRWVQGICPPGWHIPTDEEWKILEGSLDTQYDIGDDTWDNYGARGFDAGANMKTTTGWSYGNGTDQLGFSGMPGGFLGSYGDFESIGSHGLWWSATKYLQDRANARYIFSGSAHTFRSIQMSQRGLSVRCIQNLRTALYEHPFIYTVLSSRVICKNDSTAFEVKASGIPPISYQWQKDGADIPGAIDSVLAISHAQPVDAGEYRCIASNNYGTGTSNTAVLTVEFAIPTIIWGDTDIVLFQVETYSVDLQEGHFYDFSVEGGNRIDGTATSIKVHWIKPGQGFVRLLETSELGCVADTNILLVNVSSLGIDSLESQDLSVYPNPFTGVTTFFYKLKEPAEVTLQIFNNIGKMVAEPLQAVKQTGEQQAEWNAGDLPAGIYLYRIQAGRQVRAGKMVKF